MGCSLAHNLFLVRCRGHVAVGAAQGGGVMLAFLAAPIAKWIGGAILLGLVLGGSYAWLTTGAYNRGVAATEKAAQEQLNRMETRLRAELRKNESLSDRDLDCALKRLRQPNATCE